MKNKIISISLIFTVAAMSVLFPSAQTAENVPDQTAFVIWEANPKNIDCGFAEEDSPLAGDMPYDGGDGTTHYLCLNRKSMWTKDSDRKPNSAAALSDADGDYYRVTIGENGGYGAALCSSVNSYTKDFTGWISDKEILNALLPYVTVKCDLRRVDESGKQPGFEIGMLPLWSPDSRIPFGKANTDDNPEVSVSRGE